MNNNNLLQDPMEERSPSREAGILIYPMFFLDVNYEIAFTILELFLFANVYFLLNF